LRELRWPPVLVAFFKPLSLLFRHRQVRIAKRCEARYA
jgi:hypothetical protein